MVEDCDTAENSRDYLAVAEGTMTCSSGCELSSVVESSAFSPNVIASGIYDIYAYVDLDDDDTPDSSIEPIGCYRNVSFDGSSTTVTVQDWD
ncbi:MAG: hypothetical protein CL675_06220 [Bdellovibrionaceae bacterium]|nr:hypothetical protein [Pseudobdellovibrionaceae bacterium]